MPTVADDPYHFPPDLINLLINAVPLLLRSKVGVLAFFRGCGIPDRVAADLSPISALRHQYVLSRRATRLASFLSDTLMNTA
jgi:hypothetical protein